MFNVFQKLFESFVFTENEEIPERTITEKICDQMREELVDIEENIQKPVGNLSTI